MAKVKDLRNYFATATKKTNGASGDKELPFLSSASGSVNQAEISIINKEMQSSCKHRKHYT